ncbi:hypothetical protein PVK06_019296 [Gossypium arboreum]|uniref:Uncharacterized protein n=1 Tax=Gossypium arboreum TaxID=29729 RepID=A0ABR0PJA9_GOSAR|nr:hypothetical protein PVK06_019296 [Gossypium arboreum]
MRNEFVFNNGHVGIRNIVTESLAWARNIANNISAMQMEETDTRLDHIKNSYGSIKDMHGRVATDGVLHDDEGRWILGFSRSIGYCSILQDDGLNTTWDLGYRRM